MRKFLLQPTDERREVSDKNAPSFQWPLDEDGNPLALVSMSASEKIGLPKFSNVDVGPATITRFVKDTQEDRRKGLVACAKDCEQIIADERGMVLESVGQQVLDVQKRNKSD